jgi:predicted Zn-dependent peptidase
MIWASLMLASSLTIQAAPLAVELPDPKAEAASMDLIVSLPSLERQELGAAYVVREAWLDGTEQYSKRQLMEYGSQTGSPPQVILMPDHIRLTLEFPRGQLDVGVSMLTSLLKAPSFTESSVEAATSRLKQATRDVWEEALWPAMPDFGRLRADTVREFFQRYVRPDKIAVVARGGFAAGDFLLQWNRRMEAWSPQMPRRGPLRTGPPVAVESHARAVPTLEIALPPFKPSDADFPSNLLALYALGVGKGSALHRVLRESLRWSYRQEGVVWPTPDAYQPRLIWASASQPGMEAWKKVRDALAEDAKTWGELHLKRAVSMARATLIDGHFPSPFAFDPVGSSILSAREKASFAALWRLRNKESWDPSGLCDRLAGVSLENLKEAAGRMLRSAIPRLIAPGP